MSVTLGILIALAAIGVVGSLFLGIFSMIKGGAFNEKYGNRLMRARVGFQALTVVLLLLLWWSSGK